MEKRLVAANVCIGENNDPRKKYQAVFGRWFDKWHSDG